MIFKVIYGSEIHILKSSNKQKFTEFLETLPSVFKTLPKRYKLSYLDDDGDQITFQDQSDYDVLLSTGQKSVKVIISEINEAFMEHTNEVRIDRAQQEIIEGEVSEIREKKQEDVSVQLSQSFQEGLIEEKLRKMMPEIIEKIKSEVSGNLKEKSTVFLKKKEKVEEKKVEQAPKPAAVVHEGITCDNCEKHGIEGVRYKCSVCPDYDFCEQCEAMVEHPHPFLKIKTPRQAPIKIFAVISQEDEPRPQWPQRPSNNPSPSLENLFHQGFDVVKGYFNGENNEQLREKCQVIKEEWKKKTNGWVNNLNPCEKKEEAKVEPKVEPKVEEKPKAEAKIEQPVQFIENAIHENARYLAQVFGFDTKKCLPWARRYPNLNKEELLTFCLSQPDFYN